MDWIFWDPTIKRQQRQQRQLVRLSVNKSNKSKLSVNNI